MESEFHQQCIKVFKRFKIDFIYYEDSVTRGETGSFFSDLNESKCSKLPKREDCKYIHEVFALYLGALL